MLQQYCLYNLVEKCERKPFIDSNIHTVCSKSHKLQIKQYILKLFSSVIPIDTRLNKSITHPIDNINVKIIKHVTDSTGIITLFSLQLVFNETDLYNAFKNKFMEILKKDVFDDKAKTVIIGIKNLIYYMRKNNIDSNTINNIRCIMQFEYDYE